MSLDYVPEILREVNLLSVLLRIVLSVIIGGAVGMERGRKNRPAGFRTHILVCMGATLVMMTNQYVFQIYGATDPVRMGAQVVSGIGFLGAGTILVTRRQEVKGMTTAAGMWAAAGCGLALGVGFYEGAILGIVTILLAMTALTYLDDRIHSVSPVLDVYLELEADQRFSDLLIYLRSVDIDVRNVELSMNKEVVGPSATLQLHTEKDLEHDQVLELLGAFEGISFYIEI